MSSRWSAICAGRTERPGRRNFPPTMKRAFDLLVALAGLLVLCPLFLILAIAIPWDSRGPVFFRQQRMGRGFRPFGIVKFRTMVVDAPKLGRQITAGEDPRITRVGRFLRKWKLDELPQLINVVKGEMSLVGPRPEVPRYVEMFREDYACVLTVRPGITDPASLKYRDEAEVLAASDDPEETYVKRILPDKIALAKQYVARASLLYDIGLIWRTFWHVVC
jgi:lipopolysaccharide/colanic/teichoic acid biosynthesis glycosyltransferase